MNQIQSGVWPAFRRFLALGFLGAMALGASSVAQARDNVHWSIGVGAPGISVGVGNAPHYYAPQPVYVQPAPVYVAPRPVYVAPPPVYYQPGVVYGPAPVYYEPPRYRRHGRHHRHHHYGRY